MWSDYVFKLCRSCGYRSYHEHGAARCRDCQLLPITPEPYRAAQARRLPAGAVSPFTLRALAGTLPAPTLEPTFEDCGRELDDRYRFAFRDR